jgi:uncharacterized alpha/beta hydrolase family protein|tara:strand:- start:308 stop:547 length:240 start_codon:yes stop_codon:yes gene_type:complete
MQINKIMGVIFSVIVVVVGLVMLPLILTQTNTASTNEYISSFPGTDSIVELIPLLYSVGVLGLAGGVAFFTLRSAKGGS